MGPFNLALLGNLNVMACATLINTRIGEEVPKLPNMDFSSTYFNSQVWILNGHNWGFLTDFGQKFGYYLDTRGEKVSITSPYSHF